MKLKRTLLSTAAVLGGSAIMAAGAQAATTVTEAGSTLVYPLAVDWGNNFGVDTGDAVQTAAVGSGAGITDVCGGTVQVGASDAPLGYPGVKQCGNGSGSTLASYVEVPWALSATGVLYNVPGVGTGLRLSETDLADIYTGKITNWDQLQKQEVARVPRFRFVTRVKKVHGQKRRVRVKVRRGFTTKTLFHMPNLAITPVYRSDGSGDSYAFTNALTRGAGPAWSFGPSTSFPTSADASAVGGNGNSGVANSVIATKGAIGYVSVYYLISTLNDNQGLGVAAVRNAAGNFELPNDANITAAAQSISAPPAQNTGSSANPFGMVIQYPAAKFKTAYPDSTYTYAIVSRTLANPVAAKQFLTYAVSKSFDGEPGGLNVGTPIGFVPLTPQIENYDLGVINQIN
ncbi:MAG TPA: extracellular solute-binding protein [Solirubrobacteraceae bacterium]|nr:extracellular solute-binding protein [Solirubrobacteraceae bacterium]